MTTLVLAVFALAGCQYAGPSDDPVARNFSWFDYLGAENLKAACGPGASDRLRFVYNGIYDTQIRSYDVRALPGGRGASLSSWARGDDDLTKGIAITNLLSPWRGTRVNSVIDPQTLSNLKSALKQDRFTDFKPIGLRLPSNEFYWVVTGCVDGRFHANAWLYPAGRYKSLKFPAILLEQDKTGVDFRGAVPIGRRDEDPTRLERDQNASDGIFWMQLGPNGIVGARGLI
ncbi:MAG: hypothetical protein ACPGRZ_19015 [Alphaproteobacteria bacterium]